MSKSDAMRAMREARYAATKVPSAKANGQATPPAAARGTARASADRPATAKKSAGAAQDPSLTEPTTVAELPGSEAAESPVEELCEHRNMGGKSCRRLKGHSEKNHRYS